MGQPLKESPSRPPLRVTVQTRETQASASQPKTSSRSLRNRGNENRAGSSASRNHPGLQTGAIANEEKGFPQQFRRPGPGLHPGRCCWAPALPHHLSLYHETSLPLLCGVAAPHLSGLHSSPSRPLTCLVPFFAPNHPPLRPSLLMALRPQPPPFTSSFRLFSPLTLSLVTRTPPHVPLGACPPTRLSSAPSAPPAQSLQLPGPEAGYSCHPGYTAYLSPALLSGQQVSQTTVPELSLSSDHPPPTRPHVYLLPIEFLTAHLTKKVQAFPRGIPQSPFPHLTAPSPHPSLSLSAADIPASFAQLTYFPGPRWYHGLPSLPDHVSPALISGSEAAC